MKRYNEHIKTFAAELYAGGIGVCDIAAQLGASRQAVRRWVCPISAAKSREYSRKKQREWRQAEANKDRASGYAKNYAASLDGRCKRAISHSQELAKKKGYVPCLATWTELRAALLWQDFRCKITGVHESELKRRLCADHDHVTGQFRGWVTHAINNVLGFVGDDAETVDRISEYLKGSDNVRS